jgi:hypothetical protein
VSRALTGEEIDRFAGRPHVKRIAVENFLMSVQHDGSGGYDPRRNAEANLKMDAVAYKWNSATVVAILDGLAMIFSAPGKDG